MRLSRLACLVLLCVAVLGAQDRARTFSIRGMVVDQTGASIPDVTILLEGQGRSLQTKSGITGEFVFEGIVAGGYRLTASRDEFKLGEQQLRIDENLELPVRMTLNLADLIQEVTVTGAAEAAVSTDPGSNVDSVRLDREALDGLPIMDQDIVGTLSNLLDAGSLGAGGASLVVDGMETDEIGVSPSAIQEVRINNNPYSAEFSRPGRGRIEIITKQAASEYHGSFNFLIRDHRLDARNAFAADKPHEQRREFEGHFTGPLGGSGKHSFLISAERQEDDEQAVVFAQTLTGLVQENVPSPETENEFAVRFFRNASDKHAFSWSYELESEAADNQGIGGFTLPEAASSETGKDHDFQFRHNWFASPSVITQLTLQVARQTESEISAHPGARRIEVLDAFTSGGAQTDEYSSQHEFELAYVVSWSRGKHYIRSGILVPEWSRQASRDRGNFDGTFTFASLEDFQAGRPFSFSQRQGDGRLVFWEKEVSAFVQDDIRLRPNLSLAFGMRYDRQNFLNDRNNFAPRFSLALGLGQDQKTVLRAGAGIFYNQTGSGAIADLLQFDGFRLRQILAIDPSYPDPALNAGNLSELPSDIVRFAPDLRSPYLTQYSFGIEREVLPSLTLSANYTGLRGVSLFRSRDLNAPLAPNFERPDPGINELRQMESSAGLQSHSLNLALRGRLAGFFRGMVLYTLGSAYNDTEGSSSLPPNSYDLTGQWSRADFDQRHRFRLLGTFQIQELFELGAIFSAGSGRPYNLTTGQDTNQDGMAIERPSGVPRNSLRRPGAATLNLRASKEVRVTGHKPGDSGGLTAELNLDAFNVLNHVNFTNIVGNQSSPLFGRPIAARSARRMQASVQFHF